MKKVYGKHERLVRLDPEVRKEAERVVAIFDDEIARVEQGVEAGFKAVHDRLKADRRAATERSHFITGGTMNSKHDFEALTKTLHDDSDRAERDLELAERACAANKKDAPIYRQGPGYTALMANWFALALRSNTQTGMYDRGSHERFDKLQERLLSGTQQKAAWAEGTANLGGNLVPTMIQSEVLRVVQDSSVLMNRARHIPMVTNDLRVPNEASGVSVNFVDENTTIATGESTFGQNILTAKKIAGAGAASIEVIDDAVVSLLPYVQQVIAEKIGYTLDTEAFEGTGTNFTGWATEANVNSVSTTTTDGEALSYIDLLNGVYAAEDNSIAEGAAWFMNRKIFATVVNLQDDQSRPLMVPNLQGPGVRLLGFPVFTTSACSVNITRGATGSTGNVYFGDPQRLIFGDRQDLRFDVTQQGPGWSKYQIDFRMVGRWGFTVGTPAALSKIVGCTQLGA